MFDPVSRRLIGYGCLLTAFGSIFMIWRILNHQPVGVRASNALILVMLIGPSLSVLEGVVWVITKKASVYDATAHWQKDAARYTRYTKSYKEGAEAVRMGWARIGLSLVPVLLLLIAYLAAPSEASP